MGKKVPPILLSGHHANIEKWRREQSIMLYFVVLIPISAI